jgi:hypothetical protein
MGKVPKLYISVILWITSIILKYLTFSISVIFTPAYYLITLKWRSGVYKLSEWFFHMAISNDQGGNVQSALTFQKMFTKGKSFPFGNPDDTVSYILARNMYKGRLNSLGMFMAWLLDKIDSSDGGHMNKAIESKVESDQEALLRIQNKEYYN